MHICICVCVCMYVYMHYAYIYKHTQTHIHTLCVCACVRVHVYSACGLCLFHCSLRLLRPVTETCAYNVHTVFAGHGFESQNSLFIWAFMLLFFLSTSNHDTALHNRVCVTEICAWKISCSTTRAT